MIGIPLRRDVFYVSNHLSWIDILALGGASGTAFVAKAEIGTAPVVGWLAGLNRTVYVKRENRMGVAEQINELRDALAENWAITVFPEGTTTDGRSLLHNAMIVYGSGNADGNRHTHDNLPILLAGSGSGTFKTGRYVKVKPTPLTNMFLTMADAMGTEPISSHGDSTGRFA